MSARDTLELDLHGAVATITLNRPERLNAISPQLRDDLDSALDEVRPDVAVRVIRLRGAGRAFCTGYDLASGSSVYNSMATQSVTTEIDPGAVAPTEMPTSSVVFDRERIRESIDRWLRIGAYPKPIIAQVHGACLSGGLDLIGICDIVFASRSATFGHPAARGLGIPPTMGMLPLKIGAAATKELFFTGDTVDGAEAERLGIVNRVFDDDQLDARTAEFCQRVAATPLDALILHKSVINRWTELMGARAAAAVGAEFDALFHTSPASQEFGRIAQHHGLRTALRWRDEGFAQPAK
jgi:enoyl-CoA hydratase